jgi:formylmethanofuran dehydrogenase subunit D
MVNKLTYNADEIFQNIEGDPENVNMTIPPEIMESQGWKEGDTLKIKVERGVISITKVENGKE